jgi:mannose-6-phosphate isomerase-like protein (cupin superfamily)
MKRRSFLKSAAAIPAVFTQPFAFAAEPPKPPSGEAHIVLSGQDRLGEDHSLGFSHLRFKTSTQDTAGNLFIIEHSNLLPGGPPLHLHYDQEEYFYVMEGEVIFQIGERRATLKSGDSVLAPRKVQHAFSAVGPVPAKMLIAFSPAGKMEQFLVATSKKPALLQDAAFFNENGMKLLGPPLKLT